MCVRDTVHEQRKTNKPRHLLILVRLRDKNPARLQLGIFLIEIFGTLDIEFTGALMISSLAIPSLSGAQTCRENAGSPHCNEKQARINSVTPNSAMCDFIGRVKQCITLSLHMTSAPRL